MESGISKEGPSLSKESNKEKDSKEVAIPFKVVSGTSPLELWMLKPVEESGVSITYPTVCLKEETAGNEHAFHIMLNLNHKNILSMKAICENKQKSNDAKEVATFVEAYDGSLWPLECEDCVDRINHVPSKKLQSYLRQIVVGLDFLRKNDLYHGNLSWDSTLYQGGTIKLAGFRSQESKSKAEAQWADWESFLRMLEMVLDLLTNENNPEDGSYYCGNLTSLINMLRTLDGNSLPRIKDTVLEQIFFWDKPRRLNFFSYKISLKLKDQNFMKRVEMSHIRGKSWDKDCTFNFQNLVELMNNYNGARRQNNRKDPKEDSDSDSDSDSDGDYNGNSLRDYIRLICGACSHWRTLQVDVDRVIRENHPGIHSDFMKILQAPDDQDLPSPSRGVHGTSSTYPQSQPGIVSPHNFMTSHGGLQSPLRGHMAGQGPSQHTSYGRHGSQPSYSQSSSHFSGPRSYHGQSQALFNYGEYYGQPTMAPQGDYWQQTDPYASGQWAQVQQPTWSQTVPGYGQHLAYYAQQRGQAPYLPTAQGLITQPHQQYQGYGGGQAPYPPTAQGLIRQPYQQYHQGYGGGQPPYPPTAQGLIPQPQQQYHQGYRGGQASNPQQYYQYQEYRPTAPATGQAGYASAPAFSQPPYDQSGTQPQPNRPRSVSRTLYQSGYTAPSANPP